MFSTASRRQWTFSLTASSCWLWSPEKETTSLYDMKYSSFTVVSTMPSVFTGSDVVTVFMLWIYNKFLCHKTSALYFFPPVFLYSVFFLHLWTDNHKTISAYFMSVCNVSFLANKSSVHWICLWMDVLLESTLTQTATDGGIWCTLTLEFISNLFERFSGLFGYHLQIICIQVTVVTSPGEKPRHASS